MEAAHISPELPIRWVVSADRTVEIKEEVTELGCDQANERILQEETPPSSITERAGSQRWPVAVFYNVLDLAAINSFVLYKECTGENISRRDFILKLATELRQKHFDQKTAKQQGNAAQSGFSAAPSDTRKRKQCKVAKCNKNKTSDICAQCERAVCGKCTGKVEKRYICVDCAT
ncbi:UNVERIFIED_CONTAM: hypothetical protein FKN15_029124 [Acipenser sinensis]